MSMTNKDKKSRNEEHMKARRFAILYRTRGARFAICAISIVLTLTAARPAAAQAPSWTENNAFQAWAAFRDYFYTAGANGGDIIADEKIGDEANHWSVFWQEAEDIEVVEDAYYWAVKNGGDTSKYVTYINNLGSGFIDNMHPTTNFGPAGCSLAAGAANPCDPLDWSGNIFNDDLMWASMAFARAYQITGNPDWLTAAEKQFNTVWNRAQAGNGGLIQSQPHQLPNGGAWSPNLDSAINFTFVVAGYLIYNNTGDASYKSRADSVYAWAINNLYSTSPQHNAGTCKGQPGLTCAKIFDANNTGPFSNYPNYPGTGISPSDYSYNYGTAIQAAVRVGGTGNDAATQAAANYLMFNMDNPFSPYAGTYNGFNILPNYGQNGANGAGFNGIALRAVGLGLNRNGTNGQPILNSTALAWAQENLQAAWNLRNSDNVMWNDWVDPIPGSYTYHAWDCTDMVAGMLDIAAPI
jgi:hypothetical protein